MTPEELAISLRPFGQVESSFNKRHEGTGLGLPIAHALARLHGGELKINTTKGSGTKVSVLVPIFRHLDQPANPSASAH